MRRGWEDVVARVRGLGSRLLGGARLAGLLRARDVLALAAALEEVGGPSWATEQRAPSAEQLELIVRRRAAAYLRVVARWSGDRVPLLDPLFLDEDRRSIRALLRGAAAGVPAEARLAGLVPTPLLPARALDELASQRSVSGVSSLLAVWGHPFGTVLLAPSRAPKPDLFRLESLVSQAYAHRAIAVAGLISRRNRARRDMLTFVRHTIDLENAWTATQLATQPSGALARDLFIPGGDRLTLQTYLRAVSIEGRGSAPSPLIEAFRGTPHAAVFAASPVSVEDAALAADVRYAVRAARAAPLGIAPVIAFFTRLRAEVRDLRFIIWRVAAGAPPGARELLVSPA